MDGRVSKRAARIRALVAEIRQFEEPLQRGADQGIESCRQGLEKLTEFCDDGAAHALSLELVVHGTFAPQEVDHREIMYWQKFAMKSRRGLYKELAALTH
jgi:hypothetical protein